MKKKLLKIFSIIFSIATLMPTTTSVVWANGSESESEDSSSSSKANSKSSENSEKENNTSETENTGLETPFNKLQISNQTNTSSDSSNQVPPIYKTFPGKAIDKIRRKCENIKNGHFKYMAAFLVAKLNELGNNEEKQLQTPFGKVKFTKTINEYKKIDCHISKEKIKENYKELSKYLDQNYRNESTLKTIYKYLSMLYDSKINDINAFNAKTIEMFQGINENPYLAMFCGILMFAEPFRFQDGGGLSRGSIRRVYKYNNDKLYNRTPYSIVYADASCIIQMSPEQDEEGLAVFSHVGGTTQRGANKANKKNGKKINPSLNIEKRIWRAAYPKFAYYAPGAKQQMLNQINGTRTGTDKDGRNITYESEESYNDNEKRLTYFNEDISNDEESKEASTPPLSPKNRKSNSKVKKTQSLLNNKSETKEELPTTLNKGNSALGTITSTKNKKEKEKEEQSKKDSNKTNEPSLNKEEKEKETSTPQKLSKTKDNTKSSSSENETEEEQSKEEDSDETDTSSSNDESSEDSDNAPICRYCGEKVDRDYDENQGEGGSLYYCWECREKLFG